MSNFLGVGFKFPFLVGPNGGVQLSRYETNIEESVRIIIGTALGERQMRPDWGCRIRNIQVDALPDPDSAERILVDVRYEIRATNSIHNLVFPFYLTGS